MTTKPPFDPADAEKTDPPVVEGLADTPQPLQCPVVGIGASAGGLHAFEAFFSGLPAEVDPDMAFVLVQHLAPDHKSVLTELIQRHTRLQVFEVIDGIAVQPNCAYVIPPNHDMAYDGGTLRLLEPQAPHGHRLPIDYFFRSLAMELKELAMGIVLSGSGNDGAQGVRTIKAHGGLVLVQSPESSEYDSMPRAALETGLVDAELAPNKMMGRLIALTNHKSGMLWPRAIQGAPGDPEALDKILMLVREQTGHDFSFYKPSTIRRRIDRRMEAQQTGTLTAYLKYLQKNPAEIDALFRDLLIGVTQFFRDPDAFDTLEQLGLPQILKNRQPGSTLRVWVPGCSTGEEAYSIAMLLADHMPALPTGCSVQIFATDIDSQAIATARAGIYPATVAQDVGEDRLSRFFAPDADRRFWRAKRRIRDLLVFSDQSLTRDPPFSRLDLISCRNVLIYMEGELQRKLMRLFHYALKPGGLLFLGNAEGLGDAEHLFAIVDRKANLYRRLSEPAGLPALSFGRSPSRPYAPPPPIAFRRQSLAPVTAPSLRDLTEQALLQAAATAAALVTERGEVAYLHGKSGMFLEPAAGEPVAANILRMAREGLKAELSSALHRAAMTNNVAHARNLRVKTNGHHSLVNVSVRPLERESDKSIDAIETKQPRLFLVTLEEAAPPDIASETLNVTDPGISTLESPSPEAIARIAALLQEVHERDVMLRSTSDQLQTANENLMSSNEEMQSVNEELQSTNEELQTSKEELQSVNEELATVNTELKTQVVGLSKANNDMNNLLAGTGIGTVFVDHDLRIKRFTPSAATIINLIPSDVGRPVGHIVSNLVGYDQLIADTQVMLDTLVPKELEVQTLAGQWYTMRIQPYRTLDNVIDGAVISFVDITTTVHTREALREANERARLAAIAWELVDALTVCELDGRITAWNPAAQRLFGWSEAEALAMNLRDRVPLVLREKVGAEILALRDGSLPEPSRTRRLTKTGETVEVIVYTSLLADSTGKVHGFTTMERAASGTL